MLCDFCENTRVHPKPLCILFSDTKGIQWADTDATVSIDPLQPVSILRTLLRIVTLALGIYKSRMVGLFVNWKNIIFSGAATGAILAILILIVFILPEFDPGSFAVLCLSLIHI